MAVVFPLHYIKFQRHGTEGDASSCWSIFFLEFVKRGNVPRLQIKQVVVTRGRWYRGTLDQWRHVQYLWVALDVLFLSFGVYEIITSHFLTKSRCGFRDGFARRKIADDGHKLERNSGNFWGGIVRGSCQSRRIFSRMGHCLIENRSSFSWSTEIHEMLCCSRKGETPHFTSIRAKDNGVVLRWTFDLRGSGIFDTPTQWK